MQIRSLEAGLAWSSATIFSSACMLKYFWHSASLPAKCCQGCQVFPWSEDLSNVHTPGRGLLAIVMVMYATWNSLK